LGIATEQEVVKKFGRDLTAVLRETHLIPEARIHEVGIDCPIAGEVSPEFREATGLNRTAQVGEDVVPLGLGGTGHLVAAANQGIHGLSLLRGGVIPLGVVRVEFAFDGLEHGRVGVPDDQCEELVLGQPQGLGGTLDVMPAFGGRTEKLSADGRGRGLALEQKLEASLKTGTAHTRLGGLMDRFRHDFS
jgi:hypothetical protein